MRSESSHGMWMTAQHAGGQPTDMKTWWDQLCTMSPKYGYYPQASKTILERRGSKRKPKRYSGRVGLKYPQGVNDIWEQWSVVKGLKMTMFRIK